MTNIKETHPSLKLIYCEILEDEDEGIFTGMFDKDAVQKHTIDKAVLRKAITKTAEKFKSRHLLNDVDYELGFLLKELELEEKNES